MIKEDELKLIYGGVSGTIINAVANVLKFILDLGRKIGSTIKRSLEQDYC